MGDLMVEVTNVMTRNIQVSEHQSEVLVVFCRVLYCVRPILYATSIYEGIAIYEVSAYSGIDVSA